MKVETVPDQHQHDHPGHEYQMHPKPEVIRNNYRGSGKLDGKTALITGGDSGIGRAVAVHFAREGADVAIVYYDEDRDAEDTQSMVEQEGKRCLLIRGDQRSQEFCEAAVNKVVSEFGQLDILVNNAAYQMEQKDLLELPEEQWDRTFKTNIYGYFYFVKAALPHLGKGSCIINTTSINSWQGNDKLVDYASTKGAITAFTYSLAQQLADKGIRVNGVAPGPIWTPFIPSSLSEVEGFGKNTMLGRPGQPSEVAPAYVFLASEDASYITGQHIHPNGGRITGA